MISRIYFRVYAVAGLQTVSALLIHGGEKCAKLAGSHLGSFKSDDPIFQ
jgi:hypothetical protein